MTSMMVVDIIWGVDFFLGFFKAQKCHHNLTDIFKDYICSLTFWCNLFATWPALFSGQYYDIQFLKMLRIVNFNYFVEPANFVVASMVKSKANLKNMGFLLRSMC